MPTCVSDRNNELKNKTTPKHSLTSLEKSSEVIWNLAILQSIVLFCLFVFSPFVFAKLDHHQQHATWQAETETTFH